MVCVCACIVACVFLHTYVVALDKLKFIVYCICRWRGALPNGTAGLFPVNFFVISQPISQLFSKPPEIQPPQSQQQPLQQSQTASPKSTGIRGSRDGSKPPIESSPQSRFQAAIALKSLFPELSDQNIEKVINSPGKVHGLTGALDTMIANMTDIDVPLPSTSSSLSIHLERAEADSIARRISAKFDPQFLRYLCDSISNINSSNSGNSSKNTIPDTSDSGGHGVVWDNNNNINDNTAESNHGKLNFSSDSFDPSDHYNNIPDFPEDEDMQTVSSTLSPPPAIPLPSLPPISLQPSHHSATLHDEVSSIQHDLVMMSELIGVTKENYPKFPDSEMMQVVKSISYKVDKSASLVHKLQKREEDLLKEITRLKKLTHPDGNNDENDMFERLKDE